MGRHRHRSRLAVSAALLSLGSSCEDPGLPLPALVEVGPHLQLGVAETAPPVCAGTWAYLDRYAGVLKEIHDISQDHQVDYYWLPDIEKYDTCPRHTTGCASPRGAFSSVPLHEHELVHAIRMMHGSSYSFIEEGVAEYWGADSMRSRTVELDTMEAILEADRAILPGEYYGRAGNFVSYLARTYGEPQLVEFARRTGWRDSFQSFEQAFSEIYGAPIEDVVATYESSYPECGRVRFRSNEGVCSSQQPVACAAEGDDLDLTIRVACDEPATIGPRDGEIVTHVVFDIATVVAVWSVDGPEGGHAFLRRCEGGCGYFKEFRIPDNGVEWWIDGGRYVLRLSVPEGTEGEFQIVVAGACQAEG